MQNTNASPDPNLAENLARAIVQILAKNPTYTPEQVLDSLAGPLGDALKHSPPLRFQILTLLKAETNRAAMQEFQRAPGNPANQDRLFAQLNQTFAENQKALEQLLAGQRTQSRLSIAIIALVILSISVGAVIVYLGFCPNFRCVPVLNAPQVQDFRRAWLPDETTGDWSIDALALAPPPAQPSVWISAQRVHNGAPEYALFHIDARAASSLTPKRLDVVLTRPIGRIAVDCQGTAWLGLHISGSAVQMRVIKSDGADTGIQLDANNTNGWLSAKSNIFGIATRCQPDGAVQVWFAQERLRTLCYVGAYPVIEGERVNTSFVPCDKRMEIASGVAGFANKQALDERDRYFVATRDVGNIQSLLDLPTRSELALGTSIGRILFLGDSSARSTTVSQYAIYSLLARDGELWAGSVNDLIRLPFAPQAQPLVFRAHTASVLRLASSKEWVWYAGPACGATANCFELGVVQNQMPAQVSLPNIKEVKSILIDYTNTVWLGTDRGLWRYASP